MTILTGMRSPLSDPELDILVAALYDFGPPVHLAGPVPLARCGPVPPAECCTWELPEVTCISCMHNMSDSELARVG
jgi:hypothetical protein